MRLKSLIRSQNGHETRLNALYSKRSWKYRDGNLGQGWAVTGGQGAVPPVLTRLVAARRGRTPRAAALFTSQVAVRTGARALASDQGNEFGILKRLELSKDWKVSPTDVLPQQTAGPWPGAAGGRWWGCRGRRC